MANRWGSGRGGRPWRRLVESVKARDNLTCQACGHITEKGECDHVKPTSQGGTDDMSNLQWLCIPCHEAKTHRESLEAQGIKPKPRIGEDGWPAGST